MSPSTRTRELLTVLNWPGIGPVRALDLLRQASPEDSVIDVARATYPSVPAAELAKSKRRVDQILMKCDDLGVAVIGFGDSGFPPLLRQISKPPPVLYVRGESSILLKPGVAVVGTRNVSRSGTRIADLIGRYVASRGYNVVSGLALGVDMTAHGGALDVQGLTTAVLAHGLHTISPPSNRDLAERIVEGGGALVAEHPPGVPPRRAEFVKRNRIQSGLSLASVIVESGVKGGAIHQARFTRDQGRVLLTVLAASDETRGDLNEEGAKLLVRTLGAIAVHGTAELGRALARVKPPAPSDQIQQIDLRW